MRKVMIRKKEIQITEKEFNKLRQRFNPRNFKQSFVFKDKMINNNHCYFCSAYNAYWQGCILCPFGVLSHDNVLGCFAAVNTILTKNERKIFRNYINMDTDFIAYKKSSKRAAEIISKIYLAINKRFKKILKGDQ